MSSKKANCSSAAQKEGLRLNGANHPKAQPLDYRSNSDQGVFLPLEKRSPLFRTDGRVNKTPGLDHYDHR